MKALVLGSGVIGVTSAWYLAKAGFDVTVIDRQQNAAQETSFANAGQISPGYSTPWAAPGIPLKALKWLLQEHAPLAIRPDGSLFQLQWLWHMVTQCNERAYALNKERMLRIAQYSRDCLIDLRAQTGIQYEGRQQGTLQVFRSAAQLDAIHKDLAVLKTSGVPHEILDRAGLLRVEPGLAASSEKLVGALRLPTDETGDCNLFTQNLAALARQAGVKFRYGAEINSLIVQGGKVLGAVVNGQEMKAHQVVLALGSYSRNMLKPLKLNIPVYPLKGYSLSIPIVDATKAPRSTIMDETYKIAITRFDQRIRVGGMAEVAGFDLHLNPKRRATLEMVVNDLFAGAGDLSSASFWTGLRPMTPDGTPIIGKTPYSGLWLNTGHGTLGWTMACGSGKLLADLISGKRPDISAAGLGIERYGHGASKPSMAQPSEGKFHPAH